jgi:hypothetical protein
MEELMVGVPQKESKTEMAVLSMQLEEKKIVHRR